MTASVSIHGRNIGVSEKIRDYAERKVSRLDHYLPEIGEVRVDLSSERTARDADDRQVVQITVPLKRTILRSEERSGDMFTSLDMALDKIQRQIERYKAKNRRGRGNGAGLAEAHLEDEVELDAADFSPGPQIARRKKFLITPMTEDEALEQMALSQHENFFIFFNADTAKVNVLYIRKDGDYGLIEPDVA
jgi:putative sigma-54 modulation protein